MAWNRLTIDNLRLVLAEDEVEKLNEVSLDPNLSAVIQDQLDMVADAYRGAWQSKGYAIDSREHYIPSSYKNFILNYARFQIFTRFPMTPGFALDENRKKQYEEAQELLKDPYIGVDPLDQEDPGSGEDYYDIGGGAISVPWLKFPPTPFDTGFWQAYPYYHFKKGDN